MAVMTPTHTIHLSPSYHGYDGGYDSVTICKGCGTVGLYEDCHPAKPCFNCGSRVKETIGKWNPPKTKWFGFVTIEQGYWIGQDGHRL